MQTFLLLFAAALASAADPQPGAAMLGWVVALIWVIHPLQTESVASAIQRTEILGAFFYLLVLWCFVRSLESPAAGRWQLGAVLACWAGMAAKETVFTAPLLVLLVDRTNIASGTTTIADLDKRPLGSFTLTRPFDERC